MDLPNDTPAGSEAMPAFAGKRGAVSGDAAAEARENVAAAPVIAGSRTSHAGLRGRLHKIIGDPGRIWGSSFVLGTMKGTGAPDSTHGDQERRKTGAHSSPTRKDRAL